MNSIKVLLLAVLSALTFAAQAGDFQPFAADSLARLRERHGGRPFVLVFWSATCPACVAELPQWVRRQRRHPEVAIELVTLDGAEDLPAAQALLKKHRALSLARWALADAVPERVYWAVDPAWHGETPYVRFYDRSHRAQGMSGRIDAAWLTAWYAANTRKP